MGLSLTILGCCGSYPGPGQACSGYLVRGGGTTIWLDAGSGTMAALQRHVALADVDAVVLSHAHPDHWSDVLGFHVASSQAGREGIPVVAPEGVRRLATEVMGRTGPTFDWRVVADGAEVALGGLALRFSKTDHGDETLAARIEGDGAVLAYSADTGPAWSLSALGPSDLALVEATFTADQEGAYQHLSARQAGAAAREAGAARLVLTHLAPGRDPVAAGEEAAVAFGGTVEVAAPGAVYVISSTDEDRTTT